MTPIITTGHTLGQGLVTQLTFHMHKMPQGPTTKGVPTQYSTTLFNT